MLREPKTIIVDPESEIGHLLDEVTDTPLVLEKNGVRYLVSRDGKPEMSADEYQRVLDETLGSWSDIDVDALIEYLYRGREEGSRPADRPYYTFPETFGEAVSPPHGGDRVKDSDI